MERKRVLPGWVYTETPRPRRTSCVVGVRWCVLMNGEEEALKQWASNLTLWVTVTHHIHIAHDTASIQRLTYVHVWGDHTAQI